MQKKPLTRRRLVDGPRDEPAGSQGHSYIVRGPASIYTRDALASLLENAQTLFLGHRES